MSRPSVEQRVRDEFAYRMRTSAAHGKAGRKITDEDIDNATHAVLALFEPEAVRAVAELDALPVGSVVLDHKGALWQRIDPERDPWGVDGTEEHCWESGATRSTALGFESYNRFPATVLQGGPMSHATAGERAQEQTG